MKSASEMIEFNIRALSKVLKELYPYCSRLLKSRLADTL